MHLTCHILLLAITNFTIFNSLGAYAQSQEALKPSAQILSLLTNNGEVLIWGTTVPITASVTLSPDSVNAVKYTSLLTVNGRRYKPFITILTPGARGKESMTWHVHATGPRLVVRVQLCGLNISSGKKYVFDNISQEYPVKWPPKKSCFYKVFHYSAFVLTSNLRKAGHIVLKLFGKDDEQAQLCALPSNVPEEIPLWRTPSVVKQGEDYFFFESRWQTLSMTLQEGSTMSF